DVRNVFALTSVLETNGMEVLFAENGRDGLAMLDQNPDVDLILMDIMMPEMDGYETMQAVRWLPDFKQLPIISLTAKAMKGDREYALASLKRRLWRRVYAERLESISELTAKLLHDPTCMERLLLDLSINITAMFRDPTFFAAFRKKVVPALRTYPFTRVWVAGC